VKNRVISSNSVAAFGSSVRHLVRPKALLLATLAGIFTATAYGNPNLAYLLSILKSQSKGSIPVAVSAVAEAKGPQLVVRFHVTNISTNATSFSAWSLPWGHPNSISYVAMTTDGDVLPNAAIFYDLCCDTVANISILPGKSLDGAYDLKQHLDAKLLPHDSDLLVVWAWHVRTGNGKEDQGVATGVTWIHTPK
jgi:hypothetical protein